MQLQIIKLTTQPTEWLPNTIYFIQNGSFAEHYITSNSGLPKMIGNTDMINALIDNKIATSNAGALKIYGTIPQRDADKANLSYNQLILVQDATGDSTVGSGAALYVFNDTTDAFTKIAEYENMDVQLTWSSITGKPSSTPAQIDSSVAASHTHANKSELDKYSSDGNGNATYNGQPILQTLVTNW